MSYNIDTKPIWEPVQSGAQTSMAQLMQKMGYASYDDFWRFSVDQPQRFWSKVWDYVSIIGSKGDVVLEHSSDITGARWFPGAYLNYAENLLNLSGNADAIVFRGEDKVKRKLSRADLSHEVARFQQFLLSVGVQQGDRVVGFLPNMPETLIAMLATTALGAVWASASPDFGVQGVLDRFAQIEPKVLLCVDGYWYNGKPINCMEKNAIVENSLTSVVKTVVVPYLSNKLDLSDFEKAISWNDISVVEECREVLYIRVPFNHPLFIVFSSGTTGVPKCIIHCHGGVLLQHLKEHQLHGDVRPGDRLFYFTTCGWMMWNWLMTGLASGATLLLYDGSPFADEGRVLFDYAQDEKATHFGTSAKFIDAAAKMNLTPRVSHDLSSLRVIFSTGSPLSPEGFDWVYQSVKSDILLSSISGGTDILSCFVLGNPVLPVYRGEIQCRGLGMSVAVFDEEGKEVVSEKGELVCMKPFPAMPIGFWNDDDKKKFHAAYFDRFENVWCHGDFAEMTQHGGVIIYGRSDATLNPGGVRIGTAEIYRQVEKMSEVEEALVIGQDWPPGRNDDVRVVLFVKLKPTSQLDSTLIEKIKRQIRDNTTPRHVPAKIVSVADIPRTKSGKIVELAVRNVVHNIPVKNIEALANPNALNLYLNIPELND